MHQNNHRRFPDHLLESQKVAMVIGVPIFNPIMNGREALLTQKVESLIRGKEIHLSIVGGAGIGKTTFAIAIARHPKVVKRFKDGILWMNLGRNAEPGVMIARWAKSLNIDLVCNATFDDRLRAIQQEVCKHEFLIVLDDVPDLEIAYRLVCSSSRCAVIIVSDNPENGKTYSGKRHCVELTGLDSENSIHLINSVFQSEAGPSEEQLGELVVACGGNPLSMIRAAGFLKLILSAGKNEPGSVEISEPALCFARFIEGLMNCTVENQKLDYITASILAVLPSQTVAGFYQLGAFGPDPQQFELDGAKIVSGLSTGELKTFIDLQLVSAVGNTLWFSKDIGETIIAHTSTQAIESHRNYYLSQLSRFSRNQDKLQSIYGQVMWSFRTFPYDDSNPNLYQILTDTLIENGLWQEYLEMGERCLQTAEVSGLENGLIKLYNNLAKVNSILNHKEKALDYYNHALNLIGSSENKIEHASILNNIGSIYANLSQNDQALQYFEKAQDLIIGMNDPFIEANIYNNLGRVEFALGDLDRALKILRHAANLIPSLDESELVNRIYFNLAMVLYAKGDLRESTTQLRYAVDIEQKRVDPDYELDLALLKKIEKELAEPRIVRWIRRTVIQLTHFF